MPKTLGIWEWGCPKRGDAQNAVTPTPKGRLAAARGLGLLLYGSNMAGGRYAYPYGPSPTDESLKLRVLDDEKHSIVFD